MLFKDFNYLCLSGLLCLCTYSCQDKDSDAYQDFEEIGPRLPFYEIKDPALKKADSLFWAFELDSTMVLLEAIPPHELNDIEHRILQFRKAGIFAYKKDTEAAHSLITTYADSANAEAYWNVEAGELICKAYIEYHDWEGYYGLTEYERLVEIFEPSHSGLVDDLWRVEVHSQVGKVFMYRKRDNFQRAHDSFLKRLEFTKIDSTTSKSRFFGFYYSSQASRNLGNYEDAINHLTQAESLLDSLPIVNARYKNMIYQYLGVNYAQLLDTSKFLDHFEKCLSIASELSFRNKISMLRHYGEMAIELNLLDKASELLIMLESHRLNFNNYQLVEYYELSAHLNEAKKQFKAAENDQLKAISICLNESEPDSIHISNNLTNLGGLYLVMGEYKKAIESYEESLNYEMGIPFKVSDILDLNPEDDYLVSNGFRFELGPMAKCLQLLEEPYDANYSNLELSDRYYQFIANVFENINKQRGQGEVLRDLNDFKATFDDAIACGLKRKKIEDNAAIQDVFKYMEMSKASLLMNSINIRTQSKQVGIPEKLINKYFEHQERKDLFLSELSSSLSLTQRDSLVNLVAKEKETIQSLKSRMIAIDNQFFKRLSGKSIVDLQQAQMLADENEMTIINYNWAEDEITSLIVQPNKTPQTYIVKDVDQISTKIDMLLKIINKAPEKQGEQFEKFSDLSKELGDALLHDLFITGIQTESVLIIPDGKISALPFGVLANKSASGKDYKNFNYLINDHSISYAYSVSTLLGTESKKSRSNRKISLFAYSDHTNQVKNNSATNEYRELPGTSFEVEAIADLFGSSVEINKGKVASKTSFKKSLEHSDMLHLALHAEASSENGYRNKIIFKDQEGKADPLYAYEILGLNTKAHFVFLSACETGKGVRRPGEGVYSLARSFIQAGTSSVVMSLWALEDSDFGEIKLNFYKNLLDEISISESLTQAKRFHLESVDENLAHPFYWSSLVLVGKT